jgi:hypothetical protein
MAAEPGVDKELFLVVGFRELEEKDLGGEVVDIGKPQRDQAFLELMGDDLAGI